MANIQAPDLDQELADLLDELTDEAESESIAVVVPDIKAQAQYPKITN